MESYEKNILHFYANICHCLVVNQAFYGSCFEPYCLAAAFPKVVIFSVIITTAISWLSSKTEHPSDQRTEYTDNHAYKNASGNQEDADDQVDNHESANSKSHATFESVIITAGYVDSEDDAEYYLQAQNEIENGTLSKAIWVKALTLCEGDEKKSEVSLHKYESRHSSTCGKG